MSSIFATTLGADFNRLHPMLRKRFGVGVDSGYACVGRGTFTEVRRGAWWTVPFLRFGAFRNILFPDSGRDIPFTIENYPYVDGLGRETVTFVRTLQVSPRRSRRFDATMVYSPGQGKIIDYLGTHQHLATGLELKVRPDGSLHLRTGAQRFYEHALGFTIPAALTGTAELHETYDEDRNVFTISMQVHNPIFGFLFGYHGEFTCEFPEATPDSVPLHLKPVREEPRH
ncbi:hypothetical protein GCM10010977_22110 [Citricoccus zhacaiensis]|uniref:DUF4166 domain-containing protein n=1 Tax=Citricoccus zhacaiensis TaxID=489142 RepID=A0ABQ2M3S7_9MICC|nr:DUF4166 domain-containing protein [Citricoccus zhacaiensis]GGO46654.1 hypothetical protein GCM10010977_22110 [Citricoccus zhacaiensis]